MCQIHDVSSGRSPDRHQASWELCGKEGRTGNAHLCEGKCASRFTRKNPPRPLGLRACRSGALNPLPSSSPSKPREGVPLPTLPRAPSRCVVPTLERAQVPQRALWLPLGCFGRGSGRLCTVFSASFSFSFANFQKKHVIVSSEAIFLLIFIEK